MLRFVKAVGGWPGTVRVVACEPAKVEEMAIGLSPEVEGVVDRAVGVVEDTIAEIRNGA